MHCTGKIRTISCFVDGTKSSTEEQDGNFLFLKWANFLGLCANSIFFCHWLYFGRIKLKSKLTSQRMRVQSQKKWWKQFHQCSVPLNHKRQTNASAVSLLWPPKRGPDRFAPKKRCEGQTGRTQGYERSNERSNPVISVILFCCFILITKN